MTFESDIDKNWKHIWNITAKGQKGWKSNICFEKCTFMLLFQFYFLCILLVIIRDLPGVIKFCVHVF